jgi:outer membrane protein
MSASLIKQAAIFCTALLLCSCASEYQQNISRNIGPSPNVTMTARQQKQTAGEPADTNNTDVNDPNAAKAPLKIGIHEAILMAMENNQSLIVERMNPEIQKTFEQQELAVFDPLIAADASSRRTVGDRLSRAGFGTESQIADTITGTISLEKLFPTGTTASLDASTSYTDSSLYSDTFTADRIGFSVTQALLRGLDYQANMARVNQARIDTSISEYELRGFTEILLEQVEDKFWDYALAQRQINIYTDSLNLAEKQMAEAEERIKIGDLAETELAAAQAEVALRRENLINARSTLAKERINLLRLLNPSGGIDWNRQIVL